MTPFEKKYLGEVEREGHLLNQLPCKQQVCNDEQKIFSHSSKYLFTQYIYLWIMENWHTKKGVFSSLLRLGVIFSIAPGRCIDIKETFTERPVNNWNDCLFSYLFSVNYLWFRFFFLFAFCTISFQRHTVIDISSFFLQYYFCIW